MCTDNNNHPSHTTWQAELTQLQMEQANDIANSLPWWREYGDSNFIEYVENCVKAQDFANNI